MTSTSYIPTQGTHKRRGILGLCNDTKQMSYARTSLLENEWAIERDDCQPREHVKVEIESRTETAQFINRSP